MDDLPPAGARDFLTRDLNLAGFLKSEGIDPAAVIAVDDRTLAFRYAGSERLLALAEDFELRRARVEPCAFVQAKITLRRAMELALRARRLNGGAV